MKPKDDQEKRHDLNDLWAMSDRGPRTEGVMSIEEMDMAKARRSDPVTLRALFCVWDHARDVFGDKDKAWHWLNNPNRALGGATPLSLLSTEKGIQQVEDLLGRSNTASPPESNQSPRETAP